MTVPNISQGYLISNGGRFVEKDELIELYDAFFDGHRFIRFMYETDSSIIGREKRSHYMTWVIIRPSKNTIEFIKMTHPELLKL